MYIPLAIAALYFEGGPLYQEPVKPPKEPNEGIGFAIGASSGDIQGEGMTVEFVGTP